MKPDKKTFNDQTLAPVGIVRSPIKKPFLKADKTGISLDDRLEAVQQQIRNMKQTRAQIILHPDLADLVTGIGHYSHLVVLYWADQVPRENRSVTRVHPMGRKELPRVGIFCTNSPVRPNPVLTTVVRLEAHKDNILEVTGLDAVDNSPVIDIKPYVREFYPEEETRVPDWMARIVAEINS